MISNLGLQYQFRIIGLKAWSEMPGEDMILLHMEGKLCQGDSLAVEFSVTKNTHAIILQGTFCGIV